MDSDVPHRSTIFRPDAHFAVVLAALPVVSGDVAIAMAGLLICGLAAAGAWMWRSGRWREQPGQSTAHNPAPAFSTSTTEETVELPVPIPFDSGRISVTPTDEAGAPERVFFSAASAEHPRFCPRCDRRFPKAFDTCPFDATRLRRQAPAEKKQETRPLPRRYCPDCDRRYELTALFCYHDGRELLRDHKGASQRASTFKICRDCGWESDDGDHSHCPGDGGELTTLDPGEHKRVPPAFPYNRCRRCGHVGPPNQSQCPVDSSLMLPELNIRLTALPPMGHGPRRKVCPDCGTQFGGHCEYCSYDGEALVALN